MTMNMKSKWVILVCLVLIASVLLKIVNTKEKLKEYDVVNYETMSSLFSRVGKDYFEQIMKESGREATPRREWMRCMNSENGESFDIEIPGVMLKSFYGKMRKGIIYFASDALYLIELDHAYDYHQKFIVKEENITRIEWRNFEHWLSDFVREEDECQWVITLIISDECKPTRYWKYMKLFFTQYPPRWLLQTDHRSLRSGEEMVS